MNDSVDYVPDESCIHVHMHNDDDDDYMPIYHLYIILFVSIYILCDFDTNKGVLHDIGTIYQHDMQEQIQRKIYFLNKNLQLIIMNALNRTTSIATIHV